jgi:hypothetical protein
MILQLFEWRADAFIERDLRQLGSTERECAGCNLSDANLMGLDLSAMNLKGNHNKRNFGLYFLARLLDKSNCPILWNHESAQ